MKFLCSFVAILACAINCSLWALAAEKKGAAIGPSKESSPAPGDKTNENVSREFLALADVPEFRGVIDDANGYVNLLKEKRSDAPVVTKVKAGEPFAFQKREHDDWCHVKLETGLGGWMHYGRVKLYFTKQDLPGKPEEGDEVAEQARARGINYYEVTQAAARGDQKALKTFLSFRGDG
ncbi:MAG TPA: SH3 domain-containing protein, partial [Candidatus Polarisedimenticolia bacterium]|nr:SH3 domain-containing protein [Candidatus Polarisedimenticolia bacterium]